MLQMTFVNCIAILSNYFGGEVKFVLVAKVNKSLTRIFSEKISECFRINTNASKTWLKYRPFSLGWTGEGQQTGARIFHVFWIEPDTNPRKVNSRSDITATAILL